MTTAAPESTQERPVDGTPDAGAPDAEPRRRRRPGRLSLAGSALGVAFGAMSVTPLLVPRGWYVQGVLTGLAAVSALLGGWLGRSWQDEQIAAIEQAIRGLPYG